MCWTKPAPILGVHRMVIRQPSMPGITLNTRPSGGMIAYMPGFTTALELNRSLGYPILFSFRGRPGLGRVPPGCAARAFAGACSLSHAPRHRRMQLVSGCPIHCLLPSGARHTLRKAALYASLDRWSYQKTAIAPCTKSVNLLLIFFSLPDYKNIYFNMFYKNGSICFFPAKLDSSRLFR